MSQGAFHFTSLFTDALSSHCSSALRAASALTACAAANSASKRRCSVFIAPRDVAVLGGARREAGAGEDGGCCGRVAMTRGEDVKHIEQSGLRE